MSLRNVESLKGLQFYPHFYLLLFYLRIQEFIEILISFYSREIKMIMMMNMQMYSL